MELLERFNLLTDWLQRHQALWRQRPFTHLQLSWEQDWPALAQWLRQRSLADAEAAQLQPALLTDAPAPFAELAVEARALCSLPRWHGGPYAAAAELLHRHMPGRKWQQITRFSAVTSARMPASPQRWVDWCAGRGIWAACWPGTANSGVLPGVGRRPV
ncbi:hypothetical protein ULG90_14565 [Halopseudomonas pachastrellae]|nr:hypothetical protein ULG90_14565 [Halopseudomonas pachastrellae]